MDLEAHHKIAASIDKITRTGQLSLDTRLLNQIKAIARKSQDNVQSAFQSLLPKLKADTSEMRYLALLVANELFLRSSCFRDLLIDQFQAFLELVVGTKAYKPLPPPAERAVLLRQKGLEFIENWYERFGHSNKQLRVGYHYLKHSLGMRFPEIRLRSEMAERERKQKDEQTQKVLRIKFERVKTEMEEQVAELETFLREMEGGFDILMPQDLNASIFELSSSSSPSSVPASLHQEMSERKEEEEEENEEEEEVLEWQSAGFSVGAEEEVDDMLRRYGIESSSYELEISFDKDFSRAEQEENSDSIPLEKEERTEEKLESFSDNRSEEGSQPILECLRNDLRAVKRVYLPLVTEWYNVLLKVDFPRNETSVAGEEKWWEKQRLLRRVVNLKASISVAIRKCGDLGIVIDEQERLRNEDGSKTKEVAEEAEAPPPSHSVSPGSPLFNHKRSLAELFGESEEEDSEESLNNEKRKKTDTEEEEPKKAEEDISRGVKEEEEEEELEFEEVSMAGDEEDHNPGEESFVSSGSPVASRPSCSSSPSAPVLKPKGNTKVRERLRKMISTPTKKRRTPTTKNKLSTHRPLII